MKNATGSLMHQLAPQGIGSRIDSYEVAYNVQFICPLCDGLGISVSRSSEKGSCFLCLSKHFVWLTNLWSCVGVMFLENVRRAF